MLKRMQNIVAYMKKAKYLKSIAHGHNIKASALNGSNRAIK